MLDTTRACKKRRLRSGDASTADLIRQRLDRQ
jgi:hypothetical protein